MVVRSFRLRWLTIAGAALVGFTELAGALQLLGAASAWLLATAAAALVIATARHSLERLETADRFEWACAAGIAGVALVTGFTAWISAPNSADAMAYHLPRVIYWAQQRSVAFFPTPYFNQVALSPFAEYVMLYEYLLTGSDRLANFGQWFGMLASAGAVWALAGGLGLDRRAQALAALVCATIPNGILQSSGAKNDYLAAMWLVTAACLARRGDSWFAGLALGLALFTKATAYPFLWPVFLLWRDKRKLPIAVATGVLAVNGLHYARNIAAFGSPLGPESARADELFRWPNERFGIGETASNLMRHVSEQLGGRSAAWNQGVFDAVIRLHQFLGIDPDDPATTWRYARFAPPKNSNHEADGPSRWHFLLILAAGAFAAAQRVRGPLQLLTAGLLLGALSFCFYLKWQPFMARMWLPWFVLASPLVAALAARTRWSHWLLCVFLLNNARAALFENWTRPLTGPQSLLAQRDRSAIYFNDMVQWNNRDSYLRASKLVADSGCLRVGLEIRANQVEYPLLALIRQTRPEARFEHVTGTPGNNCAVICLDCTERLEAGYRSLGRVERAARFTVFLEAAK